MVSLPPDVGHYTSRWSRMLADACWRAQGPGATPARSRLNARFPMFVLFVLCVASVITTVLQLPCPSTAPIKELSKFFIVMAMVAIGFNTDIVRLVRGGKPIALGFAAGLALRA